MRTSSYIIPVKLESETNKYMLIHGYTGAMDIVTDSLLAKIKNISSENTLSEKIVQALQKRGYITDKNEEEEYAYVARIANALHQKSKQLLTSFALVITYNCNFRCPYCFEEKSNKDGIRRIVFNKRMADKVFNAMEQIQPHKELKENTILLYGGEPLLAENKDIVKYIIEKGIKHGYKFSAITNGYDLDAFQDLLSPEMICKLQITIDGDKFIHNQRRIHFQGYETFDKIISNIKLALEKNAHVSVRINTDNINIGTINNLKQYLDERGYFSYPNFNISSAILKDYESSNNGNIEFLTPQSYINKHEQNNTIPFCQDHGLFQLINHAMLKQHPLTFHSIYCSSQAGEYIFDPLGNIYPCLEVVGNNNHIIGSYSNDSINWNETNVQYWHNYNISKHKLCKHCQYALLCSGGCPIHTRLGDSTQCSFFPKALKIAVNRSYKIYKEQNNIL